MGVSWRPPSIACSIAYPACLHRVLFLLQQLEVGAMQFVDYRGEERSLGLHAACQHVVSSYPCFAIIFSTTVGFCSVYQLLLIVL